MHIRTGDTVIVISGEARGERGEVQRVLLGRYGGRMRGKPNPNNVRVIVAGVNLIIKHQRRTGNVRTQTGRIEREAPIHVSNVMLICPALRQANPCRPPDPGGRRQGAAVQKRGMSPDNGLMPDCQAADQEVQESIGWQE